MGQITGNLNIQSENIYLQGTGSTGEHNIIAGIHLRWDLIGNKLESLPIEPTENSDANAVHIYRSKYTDKHKTRIDLTKKPSRIENNQPHIRQWYYSQNVIMRFTNIVKYDQIKVSGINEGTIDFLAAYNGQIEIEIEDKMMFSVSLLMSNTSEKTGICRMETISQTRGTNTQENKPFISNRRVFKAVSYCLMQENGVAICQENTDFILLEEKFNEARCIAENIRYIRFKGEYCYPVCIEIETYEDYISKENDANTWEKLTSLGLSVDDNTVFSRLEKTNGSIDKKWPHYIDGTVKIQNYKDKWKAKNGIKTAVADYCSGEFSDEDYGLPLYSLLKLLALDYHVARMFGLGYIDTTVDGGEYIYVVQHGNDIYMSLPLSNTTVVTVDTPIQKTITYGLKVANGTTTPINLTDSNGYYFDRNARAVNLGIEQVELYRPMETFFYTEKEYSFVHKALPVMFGIRYKQSNTSQWEELLTDPDYTDHEGKADIVPVIGNSEDTLYTHTENNIGIHSYAIYGIDWFARPTNCSNEQITNETVFPKKNTLMPPLNFSVQLIQPEKVLMLTSKKEQDMYQSLVSSKKDTTLIRVTFDWNEANNNVYWGAQTVRFFFRTKAIQQLKGKIESVYETTDGIYRVTTNEYSQYSTSPAKIISPRVDNLQAAKIYIGSLFSTEEAQYLIEDVKIGTNHFPEFTLRSFKTTALYEAFDGQDTLLTNSYTAPRIGNLFSIRENLNNSENWETTLTNSAKLNRLSEYEEKVLLETEEINNLTLKDNETFVKVGGIIGNAEISLIEEGIYKIIYQTESLPENPNKELFGEWYKGTVRINDTNNPLITYTFEVFNIATNNEGKLELTVYDSNYKEHVKEGGNFPDKSNIKVNFHPGYRLYLTKENSGLSAEQILPAVGAENRQTFLTCRSEDGNFFSYMSAPGVIYARKLYSTPKPEKGEGLTYAGRPDFYGKSAYTFDVKINTAGGNTPYMLLFTRYLGKQDANGVWSADEDTGVPLTQVPLLYNEIPEGIRTSRSQPATRISDSGNMIKIRFTDYTLEGAANAVYFYTARTIDNTMSMGEESEFLGPIHLLNTTPPAPPALKKVVAKVADSLTGEKSAVKFEINKYPDIEGVTKIQIYRALDVTDSRSIRTMSLVSECPINDLKDKLADTFDGLPYPLYGELLYYRLVAVRTITNEKEKKEDIYSLPSECIMVNIEDTATPPLPEMTYETTTKDLVWEPTCYKGNYYLYKMNSSGNWTLLQTFKQHISSARYNLASLPAIDEEGNPIYHHFKVIAENSSGIQSIGEKITTISLK